MKRRKNPLQKISGTTSKEILLFFVGPKGEKNSELNADQLSLC